jgi:hypothetical protein
MTCPYYQKSVNISTYNFTIGLNLSFQNYFSFPSLASSILNDRNALILTVDLRVNNFRGVI